MVSSVENRADELVKSLYGERDISKAKEIRNQLVQIELESQSINPAYYAYVDATIAFRQDDYDLAADKYFAVIQKVRSSRYFVLHSYACVYLATLYARDEQYYLSQEYFTEAEQSLQPEDYTLALFLYTNLSGTYLDLGDYVNCLAYSQKAVEVGSYIPEHVSNILATANMGVAYSRLNQPEEGLKVLDAAIEDAEVKGKSDSFAIIWCKLYRAVAYAGIGNYAKAAQNYKEVYNFTRDYDDLILRFEFYREYSQFLIDTNNYDLAIKFCRQALKAGGEDTQPRIRMALLNTLSDCYRIREMFKEENETLRELASLQRSELVKNRENESKYIQLVVSNARTSMEMQQAQQLTDQLENVNRIGQLIAAASDDEQTVLEVYNQICNIVSCTAFSLAIFNEESNMLEYRYLIEKGQFSPSIEVDCSEVSRIGIYCVKNNKTVVLNTSSNSEISAYLDPKYRLEDILIGEERGEDQDDISVIATPITLRGKPIGVLSIQYNTGFAYGDLEVRIAEQISNYIALAIAHSDDLYEQQEQHEYRELIYHTDPLTGLHNRHGLSEHLKELFSKDTTPDGLTGLLIDIDCMKRYNESYGLLKGDQALVQVANTLTLALEGGEQLYRIGGDEFLLLLPTGGETMALRRSERIQAELLALGVDHPSSTVSNRITTTIGIFKADTQFGFEPFVEAMLSSERAMIGAKKKQRNAIYRYAMK